MSKLEEITIITQAGGSQTIKLQDYENSKDFEYWSEADKALSGKLRQNMRGSRGVYSLQYEQCIQPSVFRSVYNNVVSDLTGGEGDITIVEDGQYRVVVPTERFSQQIAYARQLGGYVPDMEFQDAGINRLDGRYIEEGYIEEGYIE